MQDNGPFSAEKMPGVKKPEEERELTEEEKANIEAWSNIGNEVPYAGDRLLSEPLETPPQRAEYDGSEPLSEEVFLPDDILDDTPNTPASTPETSSAKYNYGPDKDGRNRERNLRANMDDVQMETYKHQMRAAEAIGDALANGGFGRQRADQIETSLETTYQMNHRMMQTQNDLITDYLGTKYPNRFGGSDEVASLPEPEVRDKKAEDISDEFFQNANARSTTIAEGYQDIAKQIDRAMNGNGGIITHHIDEMSKTVASFEQQFARLEKMFMDEPTSANITAMDNWIAEYSHSLDSSQRMTENAYNLNPTLGRGIEEALAMMVHNQKMDLENRKQALVEHVQFKAGSAVPEEEINAIKEAYRAEGQPVGDEAAELKRQAEAERRKKLEDLFL